MLLNLCKTYKCCGIIAKVGGKSNSQHLLAKASDIVVKNVSPKEVYNAIEKLIESGKMKQGGLGLYDSFVHYDVRGVRARWNYSKLIINN